MLCWWKISKIDDAVRFTLTELTEISINGKILILLTETKIMKNGNEMEKYSENETQKYFTT